MVAVGHRHIFPCDRINTHTPQIVQQVVRQDDRDAVAAPESVGVIHAVVAVRRREEGAAGLLQRQGAARLLSSVAATATWPAVLSLVAGAAGAHAGPW